MSLDENSNSHMSSITVPSKIVIVGTSSISLNDRFSQMKASELQPVTISRQVRNVTKSSTAPRYTPRATILSYQEDDPMYQSTEYVVANGNGDRPFIYDSNIRTDPYVFPTKRTYVPIHRRLSVPVPQNRKPRMVYAQTSSRGFQKPPANNVRPLRSGSYYYYQTNRNNQNWHKGDDRNGHYQSQNRYNRATRAGGVTKYNRGRNNFQHPPKKTVEQMDRELDAYMVRPKHPRISI